MPPANSGSSSGSGDKPAWHTFVAGALSGLVSEAVTYPISTAKARLQVQRVAAGAAPLYRSTAQTIAFIAQREGAAKLYSGFGSVLVCCAPARALYFTAYEHCKKVCAATVGGGDGSHPAVGFIAGQIAQLSGSAIWVPQDVVKERMQVQALEPAAPAPKTTAAAGAAGAAGPEAAAAHKAFTGSFDAARRIVAEEGVRGLYRGYVAHQVVWVPYNGIFFSAYETCKSWWSRYLLPKPTAGATASAAPAAELPHFAFPACAAAAGAFASTVTYPMDLIKTRLQTQGNSGAYAGAVDCARQIVAKEGARALFRGLGARVLFLAPNHALSMTTYEKLMAVFDAGSQSAAAAK